MRFRVNKHSGRINPSLTISIHDHFDSIQSTFALIEAPVTPELVDMLRAAAKQASEALEAYEEAKREAA